MNVSTDLSCESLRQYELNAVKPKFKRRFRIVRLAMQGLTGSAIAQEVGLSRRRVYSWVSRFNHHGIAGLTSTRCLASPSASVLSRRFS